ncbi:mavicyanin-like [Rutidosis leptorrhynchoides]|uniref:mavicyanin-like n=1 Tax=Rutidosis leptorrhynchoides TaxID=125765 RepID=UPI003A99284C
MVTADKTTTKTTIVVVTEMVARRWLKPYAYEAVEVAIGKVPKTLGKWRSVVAHTHFLGTKATDHYVGDAHGWDLPPNLFFYGIWSNGETFRVNDVLIFNFTTGAHNVAEVTKEAYDACDASKPIRIYTSGPANVLINSVEDHYFICGIPSHCKLFQKFLVEVKTDPMN